MGGQIYALLVGIDTYQSPVTPLKGCVADIDAIHSFLESRVNGEDHLVDAVVLKNEQATRQNIIDHFLSHLCQATSEDTVIFYYSGHGSQAQTAPEFYYLEPDRLDETLVCYDSRMHGNYDLADKEISKLIAEVAKNNPHIVVILDSCHSGSATRSFNASGIRRIPTDYRERPYSSYLITPSELETLLGASRSVTDVTSGWMRLPRGSHVVLSACLSDEEAKEIFIDGQVRGVFSHFLLETLQRANGNWTYRDVFTRVNSQVRAKVFQQSPLLEATNFADLDRYFFGGAIQTYAPYFTVSFSTTLGWHIDGGEIHGIPAVQNDDTTQLILFSVDTDQLKNTNYSIGNVSVTERLPTLSKVEIALEDGKQPDPERTYKAVITTLPVPALRVVMSGDKDAIDFVRSTLDSDNEYQRTLPLIQEVEADEDLSLIARDNHYFLKRSGDDQPLSISIQGYSITKAADVVNYLEHIARWMHMVNLSNSASVLASNAVTMELYLVALDGTVTFVDPAIQGANLKLFYEYYDGSWHEPAFKLKLTNNSNQKLYCMLFNLTERFKIWAEGLLPGGGIWLNPEEEAWAYNGDPIPVSIPDELWKDGMTEFKDILKLIASTESCDASRFQQDNLDVKYESRTTRGQKSFNSLERLMQNIHTRDIGSSSAKSYENIIDWTSSEISITTVRPLNGVSLPLVKQSVPIASHVSLSRHSKLRGTARLTSVPLASRDMSDLPQLPEWLRDDPSSVCPFNLSSSRGVENGLSVLELTDISGYAEVTPDQPLKLHIDLPLNANEHLLPISYDKESGLYLPLGYATYTDRGFDVQIERLPSPSTSKRSLTGSINIFFQKVISEKLGGDSEYPLLRAFNSEDGYISEVNEIQTLVAKADRILLYIHGIIGETPAMVESSFNPQVNDQVTPLGLSHDLVLSFDYENLQTPIEETALLLKQRLEKVGLGQYHGKILNVVAHSMGGLVSRWFIEREGGNTVVSHLVMLGTPNDGAPWPTVEDWVTGAIGLGLNGLTTVAWPVSILGVLLSTFEKSVTTSLKQMSPRSPLLQSLALNQDPHVKYSIIAGNTSLIPAALQEGEKNSDSLVVQLFKKLNLRSVMYSSVSTAFFRQPNDLVVSTNSITCIPKFKKSDPPYEVSCDHLTYFSTEAGLTALAKVLT